MKTIFTLLSAALSLFAIDFSSIKTFQSNFTQHITNPSGKVLNYTGKLYVHGANNILWQYTTPIVKSVYIKRGFAIVDEPELEQAIYTHIDQEINLFMMINEAKQITKNHYQTVKNSVEYNIFLKEDKIDSIKYSDTLENDVVIMFTKSVYNGSIDTGLFVFKAPDHYDIIRK
ncbi:MAG: LolA-like outer membrane lipoprotein chaperone, partial [Campylobacterota bacterium]|nr:LolA-like outer membrane lipoprotein chaperone [Campylobacterota bacterium]